MKYLVALFIVAVGIASVPIGMALWPAAAGTPPPRLLPFFVFVSLCEGLSLGAGIAWLVLGRRLLQSTAAHPALRLGAHLSIAWLFVNWWAHDGLHRSAAGQSFSGVATIDVIFHTTLIIATGLAATYFVATGRAPAGNQHAIGERVPAASPGAKV